MSFTVTEWERGVPSIGPAVVALGVFDGVHLGHQALIETAVSKARELSLSSAAVTFDRDPDQVVTPDDAAPQLLTLDDKVEYLGSCGVDHVVVLPFCMKISKLPAEMFAQDILAAAVEPRLAVVGADFRFGNGASGTVDTLAKIGADMGFDVVAHDLVEVHGEPVTSTRIRSCIAQGDVRFAAELLGREHRVTGRVSKGRGQGAEHVVPTANIVPQKHSAVPADGVYAGHAVVEGVTLPAAISVGSSPTFPGSPHIIETHVLDFGSDLYHTELTVTFAQRLRDLAAFDSPEALRDQVLQDISQVRKLVGNA